MTRVGPQKTSFDLRGWHYHQQPREVSLQDRAQQRSRSEPIQVLADAAHVALQNPQDTLRRCEADLRTLDRHRCKLEFEILVVNGVEQRTCEHCGHSWPCEDIRDRAAAYGVPVEETT